jgi:ArsR family transcriptional regulator
MRDLSKIFKALSDPNRLRIIKMLQIRPLCVCEITEVLQLATSTVSKHLSILRDSELIVDEKEGKWVNYRLNDSAADEYVSKLLPLLEQWLPDDKTVQQDAAKVKSVNRNVICGI